jgi:hypothetical protein
VDDIYYALFTAGIEPMESYEIFQRMNRECFQDPINKANASLNPDIEHVQVLVLICFLINVEHGALAFN